MRCKRAVHAALALGCILWLATGPALSQTQDGRVPDDHVEASAAGIHDLQSHQGSAPAEPLSKC